MTAFCVITLIVIFFAGCNSTSKEEEILDTLLLVARNVLQFLRLAAVMRQYVPCCPTILTGDLTVVTGQIGSVNLQQTETYRPVASKRPYSRH